MNRWIVNALGLAGIAVLLLLGWAAFQLGAAAIVLRADLPDLAPTVVKLNGTLDSVAPVIAHADTAFANLSDATGDWSDASKQQARDVRALLASGGRAVDAVTEDARALKGTAGAATALLDQGQADLVTANETIAAIDPALRDADQTLSDLDALLKDRSITATLANLQNITAQGQAILGDARSVADSATAKYFKPLPWYRRAVPYVTTGAKIAAYALPW